VPTEAGWSQMAMTVRHARARLLYLESLGEGQGVAEAREAYRAALLALADACAAQLAGLPPAPAPVVGEKVAGDYHRGSGV
jgi:hypothetical protein